jgi:hypothetical protein
MFYLGGNWPEAYRNSVFMVNIHGRRVNTDLVERRGSSYVGRHGPDFLRSGDAWFRALNLKYGPDGGVYINDWTDVGECHDTKTVHRTSGRIYKVAYGSPKPVEPFDLSKKSDAELVALQLHSNDWYVRQSRRLLQERAAAGADLSAAHAALRKILAENADVPRKLRAIWALYSSGGLAEKDLARAGRPRQRARPRVGRPAPLRRAQADPREGRLGRFPARAPLRRVRAPEDGPRVEVAVPREAVAAIRGCRGPRSTVHDLVRHGADCASRTSPRASKIAAKR